MRFLSAGRLTLTMFALSFCLTINGQSEEPKKEEEPRFPLTVRVFSVGVEWRESYGNRIETFLWKKIDRSKIERGVGPIVFAADGSLWRQIDQDCRYGKPSEYTKGVFNTKLLKGEYRVSVANSKVYEEWEGPPGSRGGGGSGHQDYDTKIWHYDVGGVGGPQHVFGWVLDDPISIDGSEKEYERKITLEGVKATFTVTAPEKEAEKLTLRLYREDGFYLENGRSGSDHGLPSKTTFERIRPGNYRLCVFKERDKRQVKGNLLLPGVDVFFVTITEEGPNDFSFVAEKALTEQTPWSVVGTVRDAGGQPIAGVTVTVDAGFTGFHGSSSAQSDENGHYTLPITPLDVFSGIVKNESDGKPVLGFRFQQLPLSVSKSHYDKQEKKYYKFRETSRSIPGDLIVVGDFAKPEEVDELKQKFAEEHYDVVFVSKNEPCRIDFVMESKLSTNYFDDDLPPSFVYSPNFWIGRETLQRRLDVYRKTVFPYSMNTLYKEAIIRNDKVSVSLRFPKSEIMLGEPMNFDYVVRNDFESDLWITVGGDYRGSGRPTSFTMRAIRDGNEKNIVYEIPVTMNMGGMSTTKKIPAGGGEYAFDLCLACWLDLKEPGKYTIEVARRLSPSLEDMFSSRGSVSPSVLRIATGTLTVKPFDHDAFGKLIDQWGEQATAKEGDYKERQKANGMLVHVTDDRVIPWLIKASQGSDAYYAKSALTKFNDDRALEELKRDIDSKDDSKSHSAAANLSRSKHPDAITILLKHQDHANYSVRLVVVQAADKMPLEVALRMLRRRFNDPGWEGGVGREARRIYKKLREEHGIGSTEEFDEKLQADRERYEIMSVEEIRRDIEPRARQAVHEEKQVFPTERTTAYMILEWISLLKKLGKMSEAETSLQEIVRIFEQRRNDPHIHDTDYPHALIATANIELGRYDEAYREILKIEGFWDKARALAELGKQFGKAGEKDRAALVFKEATDLSLRICDSDDPHRDRNPNAPKGWPLESIAEGWAEIGMYDKALETVRLIDDPHNKGNALKKIARLQRKVGLEKEAAKTMELPREPLERAEALTELAHEKVEAKQFDEARKLLEEADEIAPTIKNAFLRTWVYHDIGGNYARIGDVDKAKTAYAEAVRIITKPKPEEKSYLEKQNVALGNTISSQAYHGLLDDALQATLLTPEGEYRDAAYGRVASGYAWNGKDAEAMETLEKVKVRWERQWALERIAKAQIEQGRLDTALKTILLMQADDDKDFGYPDGRTTSAELSLQGECLGLLAEAHAKAARYGEATALANRIVDTVKRLHAYRVILEAMPLPASR